MVMWIYVDDIFNISDLEKVNPMKHRILTILIM